MAWPGGSREIQNRFGGRTSRVACLDVESEVKKNPGECLGICSIGSCV